MPARHAPPSRRGSWVQVFRGLLSDLLTICTGDPLGLSFANKACMADGPN